MSKVSFSRELLGTIRFIFDKTKSRTLNATQAYDISTSQIVLASYPATSTINTPTNSLGRDDLDSGKTYGDVNVTAWQYAAESLQLERANLTGPEVAVPAAKAITVGYIGARSLPAGAAKQTVLLPTTGHFDGTLIRASATGPISVDGKSNATKEIFAGNITVGTGLYRTWQGKYAVLKVDLLTDKAILRVYNE